MLGKKRLNQKGMIPILIVVYVLAAIIVLLLAFGLVSSILGWVKYGEYAPVFGGDGSGFSCATWEKAPSGYQLTITKAANKVGVHPALLGAIFLNENGNVWKAEPKGGWPNDGPFQIVGWSSKWKTVTEKGYSNIKLENSDPNDMYQSALAAAVYIRGGMEDKNIPLNTTEEKYILYTGLFYNRGGTAANEWAKNGYDLNNPPVNKNHPDWGWGATGDINGQKDIGYAKRLWISFQGLYVGCYNVKGGESSNKIVQIAYKERGTKGRNKSKTGSGDCQKYSPGGRCQQWCADFVSWVYRQAGYNLNESSVDNMISFFGKLPHKYIKDPQLKDFQLGDVVFFDNYDHVGIVAGFDKGTSVMIIEGNTTMDTVRLQPYNIGNFKGLGRW